jgi:hypothetical protein
VTRGETGADARRLAVTGIHRGPPFSLGSVGSLAVRHRDALVAVTLTVVGGALCWLLALPLIVANLLLLGVPAAYLLARSAATRQAIRPRFVVRYVVFVVVFVDYMCVRYDAWDNASVLPDLPGGVTVEQVVCLALLIVLVLAVSERYFAAPDPAPPKRFGKVALIAMFVTGLVIALVPALQAPFDTYTYMWIGVALYPSVIALAIAIDPRVVREMVAVTIVIAPVILGFELLALHHDYWVFEGQYVGEVTVLGLTFPTEELLFFVLLAAPAVVGAYAIYKNWKGLGRPRSSTGSGG